MAQHGADIIRTYAVVLTFCNLWNEAGTALFACIIHTDFDYTMRLFP